MVVKIDVQDRARRIEADPNTYFVTEHYENYPMMVVRLSAINTQDLRELLDEAMRHAAGK